MLMISSYRLALMTNDLYLPLTHTHTHRHTLQCREQYLTEQRGRVEGCKLVFGERGRYMIVRSWKLKKKKKKQISEDKKAKTQRCKWDGLCLAMDLHFFWCCCCSSQQPVEQTVCSQICAALLPFICSAPSLSRRENKRLALSQSFLRYTVFEKMGLRACVRPPMNMKFMHIAGNLRHAYTRTSMYTYTPSQYVSDLT